MAKAKKQVNIKKQIKKKIKAEEKLNRSNEINTDVDKKPLREFHDNNFSEYETLQKMFMQEIWDFYLDVLIPMANGELYLSPRLGSKFHPRVNSWFDYKQWLNDSKLHSGELDEIRIKVAKMIFDFEELFGLEIEAYGLWTKNMDFRERYWPFSFTTPDGLEDDEALF